MKLSAILDFIILSLAVQGLVLTAILLYSSKKIHSNRWLAGFIFVIAETTLVAEGMASGLFFKHLWIIPLIPIIKMAVGPFLYFYTRGIVYGNKKLTGKDYLHFLPLLIDGKYQLIYLLYHSGILSIPFIQQFYFREGVQQFLFTPLNELPVLLSITIYTILSYTIVRRSLANKQLSAYKIADLRWIRNLLYLFFVIITILLVMILTYFFVWTGYWNYYLLFIPLTGFIYWLGMAAYIRQTKMSADDIVEYNTGKVYFSDEEADKYHHQLAQIMQTELLYLNPILKLNSLADRLSISERAFSNLLNQHIGKNFNDFVNEYRVEASKKKLTDTSFNQFTIAAIAHDCGFNSLATFQRCFKQFTGFTPSQYQKDFKGQDFIAK